MVLKTRASQAVAKSWRRQQRRLRGDTIPPDCIFKKTDKLMQLLQAVKSATEILQQLFDQTRFTDLYKNHDFNETEICNLSFNDTHFDLRRIFISMFSSLLII